VGDGGGANGAPRERLRERGVEGSGADLIEQAQHARGLAGQRMPPDGEGVEEGLGLGAGLPEAITAAEVVGVALGLDQRGQMGLVFDALPALVAADMTRDLDRAVEEAQGVLRDHERERPADQPVGDRVVVAVEADVGRLAGADRAEEVAGKRMLGER